MSPPNRISPFPRVSSQLWKSYIQLTEAEAAFRALKSELSIRPIFHQLERRAKAPVLVAFLGYALWVTLKHLLLRKRSEMSLAPACTPRQIRRH
jgi:transposase